MVDDLAEDIACMIHAFPDPERREMVREVAAKVRALTAENAMLRSALTDAVEDMGEMVGYVPSYFRQKWGIARAKVVLSAPGKAGEKRTWGVWLVPHAPPGTFAEPGWGVHRDPSPVPREDMTRAEADDMAASYNVGNVWRAEVRPYVTVKPPEDRGDG